MHLPWNLPNATFASLLSGRMLMFSDSCRDGKGAYQVRTQQLAEAGEKSKAWCQRDWSDNESPCMWPAMYRAAPQRPEGRLPVCSQFCFMERTNRRAVSATILMLPPKLRRSAKRCMYRLGSTGLQVRGEASFSDGMAHVENHELVLPWLLE